MPLLVLMYHRVGEGKHANSLQALTEHFEYLKRYPVLLPGEPLPRGLSFCLTFDDASYDFYHYVYPLLKTFGLRALVGVPVRYITEKSVLSPEERLAIPYTLAMQDGFFETKAPFCTWEELNEMVQSGHVQVASHSFMHSNLTFPFVDLNREVILSKETLETRLNQPVSSFIYPFGRVNSSLYQFVSAHYPYSFRIGSAFNFGWNKGPIRRLCADNTSLRPLLSLKNQVNYLLKGSAVDLLHMI